MSGSLSSSVGILDISNEAFKRRSYRDKKEKRKICRTKCLLIMQLLTLSAIIGLASWLFLKNFPKVFDYVRLTLSIVLICASLSIAASSKLRNVSLGIVISIFLYIVSLYVFPDILRLFSQWILDIVNAFVGPSFLNFVRDRVFSYLNLLVIPLLFFFPDLLNKDIIPKARESIPIDTALVVGGGFCLVAGFAAGDPLFEAGCSAAILIVSNYLYTFPLNPKLVKF